MTKIKILSNPYDRSLTYYIYKEQLDLWENIQQNSINSRLRENDVEKIFLPFKAKDVAAEFEYWIKEHAYKTEEAVTVEGYTARTLSAISEYLDGEGAFMLLIELREDPKKAHDRINGGFRIK